MTLESGTLVAGKYRIERLLGEGGMGIVYVATQLDLDRPVALKLMRPEAMGFTGGPERFVREARVASRLTSEHVARVLEVGTTEAGVPFFAMELLVGRALDQELEQRGRLAVAEAVDIVLEASEALAEAHGMGLVHRDIKPENLFLVRHKSGRQSVRVLDFGLTKLAATDASITQSASAFGTPQYMSPEQTRSAKYVDHRTDQHAIALVLFELLTGRPAFEAESATAVIVDIATKAAPSARTLRPEVPSGLDAAIARALTKRADDRFPSLAALARAIAPFGGPRADELAAAVEAHLQPAASALEAPASAARTRAAHSLDAMTTLPRRRTGSTLLILGLGLGVLVSGVVIALVVRGPEAPGPDPGAAVAPTAASPATASAEPARPPPPPAVVVSPSAPAVAPSTTAEPQPQATATSTNRPAARGAYHRPARASAPSAAAAAPPPDCDNPFTVDANGTKHPRRECFR